MRLMPTAGTGVSAAGAGRAPVRQRGQQQVGCAVAGVAAHRALGGDAAERAVAAAITCPAEQEQRRRVVGRGQPTREMAPQRTAIQAAVVDGQPDRVANLVRRDNATPNRTTRWRRRAPGPAPGASPARRPRTGLGLPNGRAASAGAAHGRRRPRRARPSRNVRLEGGPALVRERIEEAFQRRPVGQSQPGRVRSPTLRRPRAHRHRLPVRWTATRRSAGQRPPPIPEHQHARRERGARPDQGQPRPPHPISQLQPIGSRIRPARRHPVLRRIVVHRRDELLAPAAMHCRNCVDSTVGHRQRRRGRDARSRPTGRRRGRPAPGCSRVEAEQIRNCLHEVGGSANAQGRDFGLAAIAVAVDVVIGVGQAGHCGNRRPRPTADNGAVWTTGRIVDERRPDVRAGC